jgi:hypothetical protein
MGDLEAYKHITPGERLDTLKAALTAGRVKGEIADMYFSLKDDVRDVLLEDQLQAVHVTPLGLCVHDFKVTPCPKFLNCVKDWRITCSTRQTKPTLRTSSNSGQGRN